MMMALLCLLCSTGTVGLTPVMKRLLPMVGLMGRSRKASSESEWPG